MMSTTPSCSKWRSTILVQCIAFFFIYLLNLKNDTKIVSFSSQTRITYNRHNVWEKIWHTNKAQYTTEHTDSTVHHGTHTEHSIPQHYLKGTLNPSQWLKLYLYCEVSHFGHVHVGGILESIYDWPIHYLGLSYTLNFFRLHHAIHLRRQCTLQVDYYAFYSDSWFMWHWDGKWTLLNFQDDSDPCKNLQTAGIKNILNHVTTDNIQKGITLTNLLELLLRTVLAFPNASKSGFDSSIISFTCWTLLPPPDTLAM